MFWILRLSHNSRLFRLYNHFIVSMLLIIHLHLYKHHYYKLCLKKHFYTNRIPCCTALPYITRNFLLCFKNSELYYYWKFSRSRQKSIQFYWDLRLRYKNTFIFCIRWIKTRKITWSNLKKTRLYQIFTISL